MPTIVVCAAVIERAGRLLVTRRLKGTHLEGRWEFPGGKREPGESYEDCLRREIREELDAEIVIGEELLTTTHAYETVRVELHFFASTLIGEPRPLLEQEVLWIARARLSDLAFPDADAELIRLLMAPAPTSPASSGGGASR